MEQGAKAAQEQWQEQVKQVQEQWQAQASQAQEMFSKTAQTWNEMLSASSDMAFDAVLRNWNYAKAVRAEADKAIEAAVEQQRAYTQQMVRAMQGYSGSMQQMMEAMARQAAQATTQSQTAKGK